METVACNPCCGTATQTVDVPGVQGDDGLNGTNGQNAYTTTTADFTVPAIGSNVTISVLSSAWMALGQFVVIDGPANFQVLAKPSASSVQLEFMGYTGDLSAGATVMSGATVSPAAAQFNPTQPCFAVNLNSVDQTGIVTATITQLQFANEVFDSNNNFDVTTYQFTPTVAGVYLFTVSVEVKALADAKTVTAYLYKNGVAVAQAKAMTSASASGQAQVNFRISANGTTDYFTAYVQHDGGSNKDVDGSNVKTFFQGSFVGHT